MIRTKHRARVRLLSHVPESLYVMCRPLDGGKDFLWKISELRATGGKEEIDQAVQRLDDEFRSREREGCA